MNSPGVDEVIIEFHGGGQPHRVPVMDVQASWAINEPGEFSAFALLSDLRAAGLPYDLMDLWLWWVHPVLGTWGGAIISNPVADGLVEIGAEGWAGLLRGHALVETERVPEGGAGGLARRAVIGAGVSHPTYISIGTIDEGGEPIGITIGGQDALEDVLFGLADANAIEWIVDPDTRTFHALRRLGRDKSSSVRLVEDRHVVDVDLARDVWARPPDEVYDYESVDQSARRRLLDQYGSVRELEPRLSLVASIPEATRTTDAKHKHHRRHIRRGSRNERPHHHRNRHHGRGGGASHANTPPAPPHWALFPPGLGANNPAVPGNRDTPLPTTPCSFTLLPSDHAWERISLGDTVRLEIGSAGFAGRWRCFSRAIDTSSGELAVAGEALGD